MTSAFFLIGSNQGTHGHGGFTVDAINGRGNIGVSKIDGGLFKIRFSDGNIGLRFIKLCTRRVIVLAADVIRFY